MPDDLNLTNLTDISGENSQNPDVKPETEPVKKEEPEFLAIKSVFTPSRGDMGGGFCVIFEGNIGKTVFQVFWLAKPYANGVIIDPSQNWRTFVKGLPQLGPLDKDWGENLQNQLKGILTLEEKRKLFENYTKAKVRQLESIIRRSFETTAQCVFNAVTDVETIHRAELEKAKVIKPLPPSPAEVARKQREEEERKKAEEEEKEKEQAKKDGNFEGTIIMCSPTVDPVKGKASSEIMPGDIIGVGINGEGTSALVKKYLEENNIEPLFPVEEIKETEGKKLIYVKISDEIRGYVNITKDIKIKVKEPPKPEKEKASLSFFGDFMFFGVLIAALIGLLFIIKHFFF